MAIYSEILKDYYVVIPNKGIAFRSGVFYSNAELAKIKGLPASEMIKIHDAKSIFKDSKIVA